VKQLVGTLARSPRPYARAVVGVVRWRAAAASSFLALASRARVKQLVGTLARSSRPFARAVVGVVRWRAAAASSSLALASLACFANAQEKQLVGTLTRSSDPSSRAVVGAVAAASLQLALFALASLALARSPALPTRLRAQLLASSLLLRCS
jgi:hypothetical protein